MAAVVERSNWCKLLLALLLILPLSFSSVSVQDDPSLSMTIVELTGRDGVLYATLTHTQISAEISHDLGVLGDAFSEYQKGDIKNATETAGFKEIKQYFGLFSGEKKPLEDVPVDFYYYERSLDSSNQVIYTRIDINCEDGPSPPYTDSEGKAECGLPAGTYADTCIEVFASFGDPVYGYQSLSGEKYLFSQDSMRVCDSETGALAVMSSTIQEKLSDPSNQPLCLLSMLIGGLMVASMFFSGRSPLSILDITTPLLPKAKSISYSGITMGVGLARIQKQITELDKEGKKIYSSSRATTEDLIRYLRSGKKGYNKALLDRIMNSNADEVFKMMAVRALVAGNGRAFIDRILALANKQLIYSENEKRTGEVQKEYKRILAALAASRDADELDAKDGLHDRTMMLAELSVLNQMQRYAFWKATGEIPVWLKKALQFKYLGPLAPGNLPFIGTHIMGATASLFATGRLTRRMYREVPSNLIRTVGDLVEGEARFSTRWQTARRARVRAGLPPTVMQNLLIPHPEDQELSYLFDNYDYGANSYRRLMAGARKDVLNWLVGTAVAHFGGRLNLTMEEVMEIGKKNPEDLMFSRFDKARFSKFEADLRKILSNEEYSDSRKARYIMRLMKEYKINFDEEGANSALRTLSRIDLQDRLPEGFVDGDYTIEGISYRDAIINSYRFRDLQEYLRMQFKVDQPIDLGKEYDGGKKFFFSVGRTTLSGPTSDYTFRAFFLPGYLDALSYKTPQGARPASILDAANYAFLRIVNERWGIIDPSTPRLDADVKLVMENVKRWLQSLANPGKFPDMDNMKELMGALYAPSGRGKGDPLGMMDFGAEYGPERGAWRLDMKAHWRTVGGPMGGAKTAVQEQAYGEITYAHTVPLAVQKLVDQSRIAGKPISQAEAEKKYLEETLVPSHLLNRIKGIIEQRNPNVYFTSQSEYDRFRNLWASYKAHLARDLTDERGNLRYADSNGKPDERAVTDRDVAEFIRYPLGLQEMGKYTWWGMREGTVYPMIDGHSMKVAQADRPLNAKFYLRRGGNWEVFNPSKFSSTAIRELLGRDSKVGKLILGEMDYSLREGEIRGVGRGLIQKYTGVAEKLKAAEGKPLSTSRGAEYRNDVKSLMDSLASAASSPKKAEACAAMVAKLFEQNRRVLSSLGYSASEIYNSGVFKSASLREKVKMILLAKEYDAAGTPDERNYAAKALKEWAAQGTDGEERHVKVALLFYKNAEKTGNWADFNGYKEAVRLAPPMGAMPQYDKHQPVSNDSVAGVRGIFKKVFNTFSNAIDPTLRAANMGLESFVLNSFAKTARIQYEASHVSQYFRQTGGMFAAKLAAGEYGDPNDRNSPAMKEYNRLMDTFTRYHAIWDETITRDPRGNSSALGTGAIFSSFFHHGPAMAFGPGPYTRWSHAGYKTPWTTPSGFIANVKERLWGIQWAPQVFNWAIGSPFGISYRTYITSRWGYMSKHDRKYAEPPSHSPILSKEYREEAVKNYETQMNLYNSQVELRARQIQLETTSDPSVAEARARQEFASMKPDAPAFALERDTLYPFHQTRPRTGEAMASITNWFYSAFDPFSTNWGRIGAIAASTPLVPATLLPVRWIQSKILSNGTPLMNRSDSNPHYISPGGLRAAMIHSAGPMVKRKYGGSEMQTGVVRSHEDTWSYQAGVNAIWGNANPGASYVDFSGSLHMDLREANFLRYESFFRPFFRMDEYVEKQANLGVVKRDIDPYKMIVDRTNEISSYEFPRNTLFRFLSPATWLAYAGSAMLGKTGRTALSMRDMFKGTALHASVTPSARMGVWGAGAASATRNYVSDKWISLHKSVKYCQGCGGPMVEGSACPTCSRKKRCSFCGQMVNADGYHTCTHGLRRNLVKDERFSP